MSIVTNRPGGDGIITHWVVQPYGPVGNSFAVGVKATSAGEVASAGEDGWALQTAQELQIVVRENHASIGVLGLSDGGRQYFWAGEIGVGEIDNLKILELLGRFNQSEGEADLESITVYFHFDRAIGGASSEGPPAWWNKAKLHWRELWSVPEDVSCAALSLCYAMYYHSRKYGRDWKGKDKRSTPRSWKDARALMRECRWTSAFLTLRDLVVFVEKYPQYKIVLIESGNVLTPDMYEMAERLTGSEWVAKRDADGKEVQGNNLVLFIDSQHTHFFTYDHPSHVSRCFHRTLDKFCWTCKAFYNSRYLHDEDNGCGDQIEEDVEDAPHDLFGKAKLTRRAVFCKSCKKQHTERCPLKPCPLCLEFHVGKCEKRLNCLVCAHVARKQTDAGEFVKHRCIIAATRTKKKEFLQQGEEADGTKPALVAWDTEAFVETDERHTVRSIVFPRDVNGQFEMATVDAMIHETIGRVQAGHFVVNLVCAVDVFTGEEFVSKHSESDEDAMSRFIGMMKNYNKGNVILYAHNSSGFDTKLVLESALNYFRKGDISVIRRGQKAIQLKLGIPHSRNHLLFRDSMCHLPGSLARLAKDFCGGLMSKGYFPHKYNRPENFGKGPVDLPSVEVFEPWVTAKNQKDMDSFYAWHAEESVKKRGAWVLEDEILFYCKNDVKVLAHILKECHDINMSEHGLSPWFHATGPGFVHCLSLEKNFELLDDEHKLTELEEQITKKVDKSNEEAKADLVKYSDKLTEIALEDYWVVQMEKERAICQPALRGGRTEIKQLYASLTDDEKENGKTENNIGVHYRYADVVSMYPFQQVYHDFPVGTGVVHTYDERYRICSNDKCKRSAMPCDHAKSGDRFVREEHHEEQPTLEELMDERYGGILVVTIQPAQTLHPVFPVFDEKSLKCMFDCLLKKEIHTNMVELREALRTGDELIKVHRWFKFNMKPSMWFDLTSDLYVKKMVSSKDEPEDLEELAQRYDEKFGTEFGDKVRGTRGMWGLKPAIKAVSKVNANCGWGKHGQNVNFGVNTIIPHDETARQAALFRNVKDKKYEFTGISYFAKMTLYGYKETTNLKQRLGNGYLPIAIYVTAYSRVQLRREAIALENSNPGAGVRVLGGDTDSLFYKYFPPEKYPGVYNIPEGTLLGDWERESEDEVHGGIVEFCALAQKTYAFKCADGYESTPKTKGVRLGFATENLVNFATYKNKVLEFLDCEAGDRRLNPQLISVPQPGQFKSSDENGVYLVDGFKTFGLRVDDFKGVCDKKGVLRPFGFDWCVVCESAVCVCEICVDCDGRKCGCEACKWCDKNCKCLE